MYLEVTLIVGGGRAIARNDKTVHDGNGGKSNGNNRGKAEHGYGMVRGERVLL